MVSPITANKKNQMLVLIIYIGLLLCLFPPCLCQASPTPETNLQQRDLEKSLLLKKLELEVRDLEIKNKNNSSGMFNIATFTTSMTTLVAVLGLIFTALKQITERREEHQRRFDEKFSQIVEYLSSDTNTDAGVILLMNFLKPKYKDINSQILCLLLSHLKKYHTYDVRRLLVEGFEKSLRLELEKGEILDMDLSDAYLARANLSGLILTGVDLKDAILKYADLTKSNLYRAKGEAVDLEKAKLSDCNLEEARLGHANLRNAILHKASLVSGKFKNSVATGAQFQQARLQGAHFENSRLEGAQFQGANLCDAYFYGASFDDVALRTIARNDEKLRMNVHFDVDTEEKLEKLKKEAETRGNIDARNDKPVG